MSCHRFATTLRNRLVKIGARVVRHGRSVIFQQRSRWPFDQPERCGKE
jgi:hypothetical protein